MSIRRCAARAAAVQLLVRVTRWALPLKGITL